MKNNILLLLMAVSLGHTSCDDKGDTGKSADYLVAKPLKMSIEEFKNSVSVVAPLPIEESGKIYAYKDYVFVNDKYRGVHVIDNTDPNTPKKISFIKIAGNVDISIKDDYLYADSLTDLMVLDISDINNITIANRLENVLRDNVVFPVEADFFDWENIDYEKEVIIGWETVTERRTIEEYNNRFGGGGNVFFAEAAADNASIGQGGSLARFTIVNDFLYAVDSHSINVFNIQNLGSPEDLEDVYAGFDIETIFNRGNQLFLGSKSGMFIYDITSPQAPTYISEFQHGTACDPVVVDGDYAYVTLRGGNFCGASESGLFIVDISEITKPTLLKTYPMDGPYGLGIKDEKLFICDGSAGLKVFDKTDAEHLIALDHFTDIITFDVIPLEKTLLMVGEEILYQYNYLDNNIELISTLQLN